MFHLLLLKFSDNNKKSSKSVQVAFKTKSYNRQTHLKFFMLCMITSISISPDTNSRENSFYCSPGEICDNYESAVDWVKTPAYTESLGSGFGFHQPIPCDEYDQHLDGLPQGSVSRPSRLNTSKYIANGGIHEEDERSSIDVSPEEGEMTITKGAGGRDRDGIRLKNPFYMLLRSIQSNFMKIRKLGLH